MNKDELIARSPVRTFKNTISGGLKPGEIGIITSPSGLGKTSVLVQIAIDFLLRDKKVIHVSFTQNADYVIAWYEDIFAEFTKSKNIVGEKDMHEEAMRKRVHMNFNQESHSTKMIRGSIRAMIKDGAFNAWALIMDGFDFKKMEDDRLSTLKEFAAEMGVVVWASLSVASPADYDSRGIPNILLSSLDAVDVVIALDPKPDEIVLSVKKDHLQFNPQVDKVRLDPKTLLMK
jgi:archaellum biogenesis ATPase FlaH